MIRYITPTVITCSSFTNTDINIVAVNAKPTATSNPNTRHNTAQSLTALPVSRRPSPSDARQQHRFDQDTAEPPMTYLP